MENSISTGTKEFASTLILQERERKTITAFDVSFRLEWSTNNQSAPTASTASEASTRETTQRSTIPFLAADEITSWNQLSSTDLPRRAFLCRIGIIPRVTSASRNLLYNLIYYIKVTSLFSPVLQFSGSPVLRFSGSPVWKYIISLIRLTHFDGTIFGQFWDNFGTI